MIIIALLSTAILYLIFPILYSQMKGKVSKKKGKRLALINCIVVAFLCIVISAAMGVNPAASGAPAFLYYLISKRILIDYNLSDDD